MQTQQKNKWQKERLSRRDILSSIPSSIRSSIRSNSLASIRRTLENIHMRMNRKNTEICGCLLEYAEVY